MPLVLRLVTGSALTYAQMDGNLTYLDNKVTGSNNFFTIYSGSNALTSSLLLQSGRNLLLSGSLNISGSTTITGSLFLNSNSQTLGQFIGNSNGFAEFSVRNTSTGISASGDIVVYADNGTLVNNYIDMGINNSGLTASYFYGGTDFGDANDAYVYNVGGNLRIGNATSTSTSQSLYLFSNTSARPDITVTGSRVGINKGTGSLNASLDVSGSTIISGSFTVITGSGIEFQVTNTGVKIGNLSTDNHTLTGSLSTTGSVTINNILTIVPTGSLPTTGIASGSFMTSGSGANLKPYFWNGATWTSLF